MCSALSLIAHKSHANMHTHTHTHTRTHAHTDVYVVADASGKQFALKLHRQVHTIVHNTSSTLHTLNP